MGHHNLRFDGDPHSLSGAWSPPTSRANFCEEDYVLSIYLAEFINSLTNLAYVYYAVRSMYGPSSRGLLSPKWDFMNISLLVLGLASFLFHASLRQTLEFADELSMMGLLWSMLQALLTVRQSPLKARLISAGLTVVMIAFTVFYIQSAQIIYQVMAFFAGIGFLIWRATYLYFWVRPELPQDATRSWGARTIKAALICAVGYIIWHIDLEFCAKIRELRQEVGLPWAWVLELHGWWHILTAIGASQFMDVVREVREVMSRKKKD